MKRSTAAALFLAVTALWACSRESSTAEGTLRLRIEPEDIQVQTKSRISDYTVLPAESDFEAEIINSIEQSIFKGKVSQWSETTPLACGDYTVKVSYGDIEKEGADLPCMNGSTNFTVIGQKTAEVNVPASLSNCIVLVSFTDSFRNYFPFFDISITSAAGNEFKFTQESPVKGIFLDAYKFSLSGTMTNQAGSQTVLSEKSYEGLESATCYNLVMDASTTGGLEVSISFNDEVETIDLGNIDIK